MSRIRLGIISALLLSACTVGPNYQRPAVSVPQNFRAPQATAPEAASLADSKWFDVFQDPELQKLIRSALEHNYDLRDAVARIEEARADLGITRSNQFPNFGAEGQTDINRLSREGATPIPASVLPSQDRNFGAAALQLLSFEVDIWRAGPRKRLAPVCLRRKRIARQWSQRW